MRRFLLAIVLVLPISLSACKAVCGNTKIEDGEECDDGNLNDGDSCENDCSLPSCGNGILDEAEGCDDGNLLNADGCNTTCQLEIVQISAGENHTCALLSTGAVRCWGEASFGQLGYGNTNDIGDDEAPFTTGDVQVGGTVIQIAAGSNYTCALLSSGAVRCWGDSAQGRLGYGNLDKIGDDEVPVSAGDVPLGGNAVQLATGGAVSFAHTCALLDTGAVRCWGNASLGKLGYGNLNDIGDDETPADAGDVPVGGAVTQISVGTNHTCSLLDTGAVRCWGRGDDGRLGYGATVFGSNPFAGDEATDTPNLLGDVDLGGLATELVTGSNYTCALLEAGTVRCWGNAIQGQLGYGDTQNIGDDETPSSAGDVNVGGAVIQLSAAREGGPSTHTCALLATGNVRCWGDASFGQLGYGNANDIGDNEAPADAGDVNVGAPVSQIAAGGNHTCALLATGTVRCWGEASFGQLGYGNANDIGDNEPPSDAGDVVVLSTCGDGLLEPNEACDDGNVSSTDSCPSTCQNAICGDGFVQVGVDVCDDGNATNGDGCESDCTLSCGNGILDPGEACDDGNTDNTDDCIIDIASGTLCRTAFCGDTFLSVFEQCDDGNVVNNDACVAGCVNAICGDGVTFNTNGGTEQCDDGNAIDNDSCSNSCQLPSCGDGVIDQFEQCDGANLVGLSCQSFGFSGGALSCFANCTFDKSQCLP